MTLTTKGLHTVVYWSVDNAGNVARDLVQLEEARSAYKSALEKADAKDAVLRGSIQLRLDALGTEK